MKIRPHPRLHNIRIGDEVYCLPQRLAASVHEVFPAAVCVRVGVLAFGEHLEMLASPQLWRADDIENLSVCHYCGSREEVCIEQEALIPVRICPQCAALAPEERPLSPPLR